MLIKLVVKISSHNLVSAYRGYTLIVFMTQGVLNGKKVENHWIRASQLVRLAAIVVTYYV